MKDQEKFTAGTRVMTPDGEGEVVKLSGTNVEVKLNSGEIRTYNADKVEDDSDAG